MQKLIEAGLFGDGLYEITSIGQVNRYNECLIAMGKEPTKLKTFKIDGIGWSPEIAEKRNDNYYLSHGSANSYFIIISPDQYNQPVYFPSHSFDRALMKIVFETSHESIEEITKDTGLWIEADQEIDIYREPADLLMLDSVKLTFHTTNGIMESCSRLHELIKRFRTIDTRLSTVTDNWSDIQLRNEIRDISVKFGDLRYRVMRIEDLSYHNVNSFYTREFDGVTIFRNKLVDTPLMILHNNELDIDSHQNDFFDQYYINDENLIEKLEEMKLVEINQNDFYQQDIERLKRMLLFHFVMAFSMLQEVDHTILEVMREKVLFQKYLKRLVINNILENDIITLKKIYKIMMKYNTVSKDRISKHLYGMLLHPSTELDSSKKALVWNILTHKYPEDFMSLYSYNKNVFLEMYKTWPECVKIFVIDYLTNFYEPWNKQNIKLNT